MTQTPNHATRIFKLLAVTYIAVTYIAITYMISLSGVYALRTINTINDINNYQTSLREIHLATDEIRNEYLNLSSPEFNAAMKDPYFKSSDYLNEVKSNRDNAQKMFQEEQITLAQHKTQADRFVLAREAYKKLEKSFPEYTAPVMDEQMTLMVFLALARDSCANDPHYPNEPNDPYSMIAKKYNFCSIK